MFDVLSWNVFYMCMQLQLTHIAEADKIVYTVASSTLTNLSPQNFYFFQLLVE